MMLHIQLFAGAQQALGAGYLEVELPDGATVSDLRDELMLIAPTLHAVLPHCLFAVDADYASDETELTSEQEIALIPPVSGG